MTWSRDPGSFRDPSGFVFVHEGTAYRQINAVAAAPFRALMTSGLYDELVANRLLVSHEEVPLRLPGAPAAHAVVRPEQVPFVSYPYEWCFSQLKAAALLTLDIQRRALGRGMVLRDASAYNVQFLGSRPVFIDTLSFGPHVEGEPWVAYRQFCQHFLGPLAVAALVDPSLADLLRAHIDGLPLRLASNLLPLTSRLKPGLLMHLHLHARSAGPSAGKAGPSAGSAGPSAGSAGPSAGSAGPSPGTLDAGPGTRDRPGTQDQGPGTRDRMSRTAILGLVDSLERTVRSLSWTPPDTLWSTYDTHLNYSEASRERKRVLVGEMLARMRAGTVWDLGANTGMYSRLAADAGARVISFDGDPAVVEKQFLALRQAGDSRILPLVQDLSNPSPSLGWNHAERRSLGARGPADGALALALVHHLAIGGNVPLSAVAEFFAGICRRLIIEFVPKEDSQVTEMLALREDVFADYAQPAFEEAFGRYFGVACAQPIDGTVRTLYLMERR